DANSTDISLMATERSNSVSSARKTSPIPPWPSWRTTRYFKIFSTGPLEYDRIGRFQVTIGLKNPTQCLDVCLQYMFPGSFSHYTSPPKLYFPDSIRHPMMRSAKGYLWV